MKKIVVIFDKDAYLNNGAIDRVQVFHNDKDMVEWFHNQEWKVFDIDFDSAKLRYQVNDFLDYYDVAEIYWANSNL